MTFDTHRYGALIVLDRWSTLVAAFGPHLEIGRRPDIIGRAAERVRARGRDPEARQHAGGCRAGL